MISNIPPPRVPFIDGRTGLVSREWFMFLLGSRNSADLSAENITYTESYQSLSGQDNQEDQQQLYPSERETVVEEYFCTEQDLASRIEDIESIVASWPMAQEAATATIVPGGPSPGGGYSYFPNGW